MDIYDLEAILGFIRAIYMHLDIEDPSVSDIIHLVNSLENTVVDCLKDLEYRPKAYHLDHCKHKH